MVHEVVKVKGLLFDMDGTPADERTMTEWCIVQGIDPQELLKQTHGTRSRDIVQRFQITPPGASLSETELSTTAAALDAQMLVNAELMAAAGEGGITALPGAKDLLAKLDAGGARWGIVTSGTRAYALSALATVSIKPPFLITAEKYSQGKPNPEPYLTGLVELNARFPKSTPLVAADALVIEDSPAGVVSGLDSGCQVLGVCTGQPGVKEYYIQHTEATFKVVDLTRVEVVECDGEMITLRIKTLGME